MPYQSTSGYIPPDQPGGSPMPGQEERIQRIRLEQGILYDVRRLSRAFAVMLFLEALILFLFSGAGYFISGLMDIAGLYDNEAAWEIVEEIYTICIYSSAFLIPYLLYGKMIGYRLREIPHARPYGPVTFSSVGICMGVSLVGSTLSIMALTFFSSIGLYPPDFPGGYPGNPVAFALNLANGTLLPAVIEETAYRGVLLGSLRRYGDRTAILLSSLFFGLGHGNMAQLPHAFLLGLAMAYFVVKTNSIFTSMFIHFMNNAIVTVIDLMGQQLTYSQYAVLNGLQTLLYIVCFIIAAVYLFSIRKVDWRIYPSACPVRESRISAAFLSSIPMILALLMLVVQIFMSFTRGEPSF